MTAADQDLGDQHRPVHSALPPAAKDFQGQRAGVVTRCLAAAVNFGVVVVMLAAVYFAIAGAMLLWDPKHADLPNFPRSLAVTTGGVLAIIYLAASWSTSGRTVGDQLLGLRVEGRGGERLHILRSLLRACICVLFPSGCSSPRSIATAVHWPTSWWSRSSSTTGRPEPCGTRTNPESPSFAPRVAKNWRPDPNLASRRTQNLASRHTKPGDSAHETWRVG